MTEDFLGEHEDVLRQANDVYKAKSHVRGQLWLTMPPSDKIRELRERVNRIEAAYGRLQSSQASRNEVDEAIIEDSIDIINYAAFLIKQIRRGHRG